MSLRSTAAFFLLWLVVSAAEAQNPVSRAWADLGAPAGPTINRHIYGHFAEHLGRDIYGGFWIKGDNGEWGLNWPVIEALKELNPPNVRWPGGCFADYYFWNDGIGPRDERPTIVNTMWGGVTEDNSFGTHEFMQLVEELEAEPIVVGNVGSGTVQQMAQWWEYLNHPGPSPMANLRAENGRDEPWNVRFWGVGNESWGCGGAMTPEFYADQYRRFAEFIRSTGEVRPFKIATGPSDGDYRWTEVIMREAGNRLDGIDLHHYTVVHNWSDKGSATEFDESEWHTALRKAIDVDELIRRHSAIMDQHDPNKRVWLIVGEWGMWHNQEPGSVPGFLYQQNSLRDALVASVSLDIFNRHADRVRMANIAQTINVLQAMILTDGDRFLRTPTFHVFEMYKRHQDAELIPLRLDAGEYEMDGRTIPATSATLSRKEGRYLLTVTNLNPGEARRVEFSLRGSALSVQRARILTAELMTAHNTFDTPDAVQPTVFDGVRIDGETVIVDLPPKSIVAIELE